MNLVLFPASQATVAAFATSRLQSRRCEELTTNTSVEAKLTAQASTYHVILNSNLKLKFKILNLTLNSKPLARDLSQAKWAQRSLTLYKCG